MTIKLYKLTIAFGLVLREGMGKSLFQERSLNG